MSIIRGSQDVIAIMGIIEIFINVLGALRSGPTLHKLGGNLVSIFYIIYNFGYGLIKIMMSSGFKLFLLTSI